MKKVREIKISPDIVEEDPTISVYDDGTVFLKAYNQGGYDSISTDLKKLIEFLRSDSELCKLLDL